MQIPGIWAEKHAEIGAGLIDQQDATERQGRTTGRHGQPTERLKLAATTTSLAAFNRLLLPHSTRERKPYRYRKVLAAFTNSIGILPIMEGFLRHLTSPMESIRIGRKSNG